MAGRILSLVGSIAFVATLISGVPVPNTARADNCITAPNASAPEGSHWYFRLDWKTQHKCWYTRAPSQPAQHATAHATSEAPPAAQSHSVLGSTPHTPILPQQPKPGPAVSTTPERRNHRAVDAGNVRSAIKHVAADAKMDGPAPAPAAASPGTSPPVSTTTQRRNHRAVDAGNVRSAIKHVAADAKMDGPAPAPAAASPGTSPAVSTTMERRNHRAVDAGNVRSAIKHVAADAKMDGPAPAPSAASPSTSPAVSTTDKVVQQSGHEGIAAPSSMLGTSAPQSSTSPQTGAEMDGLAPAPAAASPGTSPAVSTTMERRNHRAVDAGNVRSAIKHVAADAKMDGPAPAPSAASPSTSPAVSTTDKVVQQSGHEGIAAPSSMLGTSAPQSSTSPQPGAEMDGLAPAPAAASPGTLPAVSTTTNKVVQQSGQEGIAAPSMLETSAPQSSTSPQPGAKMAGLAPAPAAASPGTLPAVSTTTDKVVQQSGHEGIAAPSMLGTSAPQSSTLPQTGAEMDGLAPAPAAASPGTLPAVSTTTNKVVQQSGQEGIAAPSMLETSAPQSSTSPQPGAKMAGLAPAPSAASPGTLPAVSTTTDKVVQQSGHEGIAAPSMLETSAPQSSRSPQTGAEMAGLAPAPAAASPGTLPAVSTTTDKVVQQSGHEGIAVPSMLGTSAPQSSTSPQTGAEIDGLAPAPAAASPGTLPAVSTTTDKVVQQSGHERIAAPSMLETSAPQSSRSPQPGAKMAELAPAPAAASPGTLPAVSTTTDKVVQQSGHQGIAVPSMLETSAPQSSTSPQTGAKMALAPAPAAASPGTLPAVTTLKAPQRIVVPTDAPADSVRSNADALASDDADSTGRDREPTTNPGMAGFLRLTPKMLLIFALGLAVLGTLSRIVIKIAAARASVDERQGHHSPISTTRDYGPRQLSRAADERQDSARNNRAIGGDDKLAQLVQELVVSICRS